MRVRMGSPEQAGQPDSHLSPGLRWKRRSRQTWASATDMDGQRGEAAGIAGPWRSGSLKEPFGCVFEQRLGPACPHAEPAPCRAEAP